MVSGTSFCVRVRAELRGPESGREDVLLFGRFEVAAGGRLMQAARFPKAETEEKNFKFGRSGAAVVAAVLHGAREKALVISNRKN